MTLRLGDQADDVRAWQEKLIEGGYLPAGSADGVFGEATESATRAFQSAHGLAVDGIVGAETWGNMMGDPNFPNNSAGTLSRGSGGGSNSSSSSADLKSKFPQFGHLVDHPEIGPILAESNSRALTSNPMSQNEFEAKIMATNWWKTTQSSARAYYNQQFSDPATFDAKIRDYSYQIQVIAGQLGYDESILTPAYISDFANRAYRDGLTPAQMKAMIADELTGLVGVTERSTTLQQLREISQGYGFLVDQPTQNYWLREINAGRQTIEGFEGTARAWATSLFPHLTNMFQQGMNLRQIQEPYKRLIEQELELAPEQIDFIGNTKWRNVLDYVDPKDGVHRTMSMRELTEYVRGQDEWRRTKNGRESVAEVGEQLLRSFGAVA